jgi:PKD repeat protein
MNKIFTFSVAFFFAIQANSQITITSADMPRANDTARVTTASGTIQLNQTGSDFTWNFANLNMVSQDVIRYQSPLQTPYALYFAQSTFGLLESDGNIASLLLQNTYGFYRNTTTALVYNGRGASVQGLPLGINYNPRDTIYRFPLNYGDKDSSNFYGQTSLLIGDLKISGKRVTEVDGWGKITTPFGTFDCIRVKSVITETDTVVFSGFSLPVPNNRTEYKWLAKGVNYPVLQVTVTQGIGGGGQTITFLDKNRPELFVNNARFNISRTISQIGDTINLTDQSVGNPTSWQWTITPNTFRFVAGTSASSQNPRIIFDANGKYTINLRVTYNGGSDDTTRVDVINIVEGVKANFFADKTTTDPSVVVNFFDSSSGNPTAYQWTFVPNTVSFVNATSATSKNPKVVFNNTGNYSVTLRVTGASGSNTLTKNNYIVVWPTSVKEVKFSAQPTQLSIIPNPAKDVFTLGSNKSLSKMTLQVVDILGKEHDVIITKNNDNEFTVSIAKLPVGIYFLRANNGAEQLTKKFVKQ